MIQASDPKIPLPMTFAGGPTYMPEYLKNALKQKMFQKNSYLNINSNNKEFWQIIQETRLLLCNILSIPNDRQIWFLGGGCHLQFGGLPLNFIGDNEKATANYATTGYFSKLAFSEAKRFCNAKSISTLMTDQNGQLYPSMPYQFDSNAAYTHFIENQSVQGISFTTEQFPVYQGVPLFNDCSSSFLTRTMDWSKIDMAYAHVQKNAGISGLTVMILNQKSLQTSPHKLLPQLCSFESYKKKNGYHADMNILPIYSNYISCKHIWENGGLNINDYEGRSKRLYEVLDKYKIYRPRAKKQFRSPISVTWTIDDAEIHKLCLLQGEKNDLYEFKGHRTLGGFRACLFTPIPDESVYRLADFLEQFAQKYE